MIFIVLQLQNEQSALVTTNHGEEKGKKTSDSQVISNLCGLWVIEKNEFRTADERKERLNVQYN